MKWLLMLLAVLLAAPPAHADLLMVSSGIGIFDWGGENIVGFGGEGWSVSYRSLSGGGLPQGSDGVLGGPSTAGMIDAFGDHCAWTFDSSASCGGGRFLFQAPGYPVGVFFPPGTIVSNVPATLTGHLNIGPGYDFTGTGTLTAIYRGSQPDLRFAIVPEPSTLTLVLGGI